ncbi:biotin synthase, partial [Stylosanthes scabra]|nr:biotin synthase [Stylosanthes scabra]
MFLVRPIFRRTHQLTTSIGFLQSCHRYSSSPSAAAIQAERTIKEGHRNDWTRPEVKSIYDSPILDLLFHGAQVHRHAQNFREVQQCTLLSV